MAWIEGISKSSTFLRDMAHIMTNANKLPDGSLDTAKNWELIFPSPYDFGTIVDVADERQTGVAIVNLAHKPISETMLIVVRHLVSNGAGGFTTTTLIKDTDYTVDYDNGKITVLQTVAATDIISTDYSYIVPSLNNALANVTDRFVALTKTTAAAVPETTTVYNAPVLTVSQISVYAEFQMPRNLINPETNTADYKDLSGLLKGTDRNRHYAMVRMFDTWDKITKTPTGTALTSEWSKLSWMRDFREILSTDATNNSPTTTSKPFFAQTKIAVNLEDMPIQFWLSCNNDCLVGVIGGEAAIDPDNALSSFLYLGTLDKIEDAEADVIGNFALMTSSATLPTLAATAPETKPLLSFVDATVSSITLPGNQPPSYALSYLTDEGESPASKPVMYTFENPADRKFSIRMGVSGVPLNARAIRLYRNVTQKAVVDKNADKFDKFVDLPVADYIFNHNVVSYDNVWAVTVAREYTYTNGYYGGVQYFTEHPVPADKFLIEGTKVTVAVSEINAAPAVGAATGRFRLRVTTKIEDPNVKYGDGSAWELVYETSDTSTQFVLDNGLTPDAAFKPFQSGRPIPGVQRDINGRVISVRFPSRWGQNTATGVLDISMFKTKSGVPFQKHVPAFVSTSKSVKMEAVNPSRWTGKVYLSPVYVLHPFDGDRGRLRDVFVVPRKNLVHLDELIVDKTLPTEKHYKLFRVSAPFSIFASSAFPQIGVAIRKS